MVRVLLADDHAAVRRALRRLLGSEPGIEVCGEAQDGEAVVLLAAATRPDVVVLDFAMPRLDGIAAARRIRAAIPHVKAVIVTAYPVRTVLAAASAAGVDAVLDKADVAEQLIPVVLGLRHRMGAGPTLGGPKQDHGRKQEIHLGLPLRGQARP